MSTTLPHLLVATTATSATNPTMGSSPSSINPGRAHMHPVLPASPKPSARQDVAASPRMSRDRNSPNAGTSSPSTRIRPVIFLVGEVSSGKSSVVNALTGGYVANASLQRETFHPSWYEYSTTGHADHVVKLTLQQDEIHKQNQQRRKQMIETKIPPNQEEMDTIQLMTQENKLLPDHHGIGDYVLVDFPGLNDAEDAGNQFVHIIEKHRGRADLVVFITQASCAFQKTSEVALFKQLQNWLKEENDNGHYVELILLVNQFDTITDQDLNEIYQRIPKILASDQESEARVSMFRFSSHKLFLHTVYGERDAEIHGVIPRRPLSVFVPDFILPEIEKCLQHANVNVTEGLDADIYHHKLDGTKIQFGQPLSFIKKLRNQVAGTTNTQSTHITGDWDGFIAHLHQWRKKLPDKQNQVYQQRLARWVEMVKSNIRTSPMNNSYTTNRIAMAIQDQCTSYFKEVTKIHGRMVLTGVPQRTFDLAMADLLQNMMSYHANRYFLLMLTYYAISNNLGELLELIIDTVIQSYASDPQYVTIETQAMIMYQIVASAFKNKLTPSQETDHNGKRIRWVFSVLANSSVYGNSFDGTCYTSVGWAKSVDKLSNEECTVDHHNSWLIHNLLALPISKSIKLLLKLAIIPVTYLQVWDQGDEIPWNLCAWIDPNVQIKLRYLLRTCQSDQPLQHRFFGMYNDETLNTFVQHTNRFRALKLEVNQHNLSMICMNDMFLHDTSM